MKFGVHLERILRELCGRVGAKYEDIDFEEYDWYIKYEWTREEEDGFSQWLADYLYRNKEARKEMLSLNKKTKKHCKTCADFFVFMYGWRVKEIKDGN